MQKVLSGLPAGLKIIDIGAGQCRYKKYCGHLEYVSQDFNQYSGTGDGKGIQTGTWDTSSIDIISDITSIPVEDESFDVVLCTEVLEHVPDPILSLNEMARILKKKGTMVVTSPMCSFTHFAPYHYCDGFNRYFYEHHFKRLGIQITEITPNGNYFKYMCQELLRLPDLTTRYTGRHSTLLKMLSLAIIQVIKFYDKHDSHSSELICFGYHVTGVKH